MALLSPFPSPGSTCTFCKAAPATLLVKGHLVCERHKNSEIIELGSSSSSSSASASSPNVQDANAGSSVDNDNDVLHVWEPAAAAAAAAAAASPPPPPTPPSNAPAHAGIIINSGSSSGARSTSSAAGSQRKRRSPASAPLVAIPPWGSPAAPLTVSLEALSDDDDDVRFTGTSVSSGVLDLTGASASALGKMGFGGSSRGGGGGGGGGGGSGGGGSSSGVHHRRRRRSLPLPVPPPAGTEVVDLAAAAAFFGVPSPPPPQRRRRPSSLGGAGSDGGAQQQHQPVLETPENGIETARKKKRRAEGKQRAAVRVDETAVTTPATAVGAGAGAGAGAALDGSKELGIVNSALSAAKQGKGRPQKKRGKKRPAVECIVCFDNSPMDRCARCPEGHAMCKTCVTSYVTETLMPQGTIFWDRIKCGGSSTCGHLFGPSVTSVLPRPIVRKIETKQMDVAHLVAGERDPTSDKWISKHSKDCSNCGVPIQKSSGCMHMTCVVCRHNFWYDCDCKYPGHTPDCKKRRMY